MADQITTTLNKIRSHSPCVSGWEKLLRHLGKTQADDEPVSLLTILDSNGLDDALWCLRAVDGHQREMRLYAVWCARQVQHLMTEPCLLTALDVAERYANGEACNQELDTARDAVEATARATASAAAWATAWGTAWAAARATASAAAWATASAAAWKAARDAQAAEFRRVFGGGNERHSSVSLR